MPYEILLTESLGKDGSEIVYVKPPESNKVSRLDSSLNPGGTLYGKVWNLFKEVLLPRGYPESVSQDYTEYQIWDTIQAFSSTIGHTLTTHAVLVGVGVGNKEASALGAAITWIFKDGVGMLSRIVFAWSSGSGFDSGCKKWRLFADVLNDAAMLLELLLLPFIPVYSMQLLCLSSSMKAVVGVAGGATRAAVTQHQAISENMGDVSAKDGSQETCVNLIASIIGVFLLSHLSETFYVYPLFFIITLLHIYANYKAVCSLKFKVLNPERFHLIVYHYMIKGQLLSPNEIAKLESVSVFSGFTDRKLTGCKLKLGCSLQGCNLTSNQLRMLSSLYKERKFMLVQQSSSIRIVLSKRHHTKDLFEAYFYSLLLAIAFSFVTDQLPRNIDESDLSEEAPFKRFLKLLQTMPRRSRDGKLNIEELIEINQACEEEFSSFWSNTESAGWCLNSHQLHGADAGWRATWGPDLTSQHLLFKPHSL